MNAQQMISDLMAAGLTQMEIERRTGIDQSTVSSLYTGKRGKRVSYEVVSKLLELHKEVIGDPKEGE
ncbi:MULTISPECIES: helix-turn-helix domain-containing protein [Burkholderia]|uniref:helix-turn-helix domain-containing protein n=1 Tax=Burkholderia TaxID=32008 RepID=UPI000B924A49|nr:MULTISPECIES: helix-turn-helix transcriptional regulator [Burkholderia]MBY4726626.1 helix-turn-helix domain-containing protein [Burkholderia contaminans]MCI3970610.1 helix-turn-helix domain-containing protein [Burkholderia sp. HI4860]MDN7792546.1 helix-turn-helix transcriptional regulator [Burkholderia contaminans]OXJ04627.1 transcriptional regulator [Burkholderia sp. AU33647]